VPFDRPYLNGIESSASEIHEISRNVPMYTGLRTFKLLQTPAMLAGRSRYIACEPKPRFLYSQIHESEPPTLFLRNSLSSGSRKTA
jgi:hypothetical protein